MKARPKEKLSNLHIFHEKQYNSREYTASLGGRSSSPLPPNDFIQKRENPEQMKRRIREPRTNWGVWAEGGERGDEKVFRIKQEQSESRNEGVLMKKHRLAEKKREKFLRSPQKPSRNNMKLNNRFLRH